LSYKLRAGAGDIGDIAPVADSISEDEMGRAFAELWAAILKTAQSLPDHRAFIQSCCRAERPRTPAG
jgi:hypothetical protein